MLLFINTIYFKWERECQDDLISLEHKRYFSGEDFDTLEILELYQKNKPESLRQRHLSPERLSLIEYSALVSKNVSEFQSDLNEFFNFCKKNCREADVFEMLEPLVFDSQEVFFQLGTPFC